MNPWIHIFMEINLAVTVLSLAWVVYLTRFVKTLPWVRRQLVAFLWVIMLQVTLLSLALLVDVVLAVL